MSAKGVNRVVISVKDIKAAAAFYTKLLDCTFVDQSESAKAHGLSAMISWDAGIELIAPLPGQEKEFLKQRGLGVYSIVFAIDDVDGARRNAENMGIGVWGTIEFDKAGIDKYFQGRFGKFKEILLDPAASDGVRLTVGQFDLH